MATNNSARYLSPFRYPGGKSWFIKTALCWLHHSSSHPRLLVEPFAGGAGISLAAVHSGAVSRAVFAEIDAGVAATWRTVLNGHANWLANRITSFRMSRTRVRKTLQSPARHTHEAAFQCLLHNRTARGGILAPGAGLIREGERGHGLSSRWYPEALADRITTISSLRPNLHFTEGDGFALIRRYLRNTRVAFFVDPPYTEAARRLYRHWQIDHEALFALLSRARGDVLMTYDDTPEIRSLARRHGFRVRRISMRTTHHETKRELMICKDFTWLSSHHAKR